MNFLLIALAFGLQIPLYRLDTKPVPITQIEYFKRILDFTRSAYCLDGLQDWKCPTCTKDLHVKNVRLVGEYHSHVFGYVAYSQTLNSIIVSFRGTRNIRNWIQDLEFAKPDHPFHGGPEDAKVHFGFLEAWTFLKPEVMEGVVDLVKEYPLAQLLITGHSLGGAISVLCATDLYLAYPNLVIQSNQNVSNWNVFTLGQPRVGNAEFAVWFNSFPIQSYRVVNQNDLTPHLPPHWAGFEHNALEVYIRDEEGTTEYCVAENEESEECANSNKVFSMLQHPFAWGILVSHKACILQP